MADAIQQNYRAAYFDLIEAEQPIELAPRAKENISGMSWKPNEISYTIPQLTLNQNKP